jgi:predicted transcriptional regulator YdeE
MKLLKIKDYGFPVFRLLNQWQVTLFRSHNVKLIDTYVSVDKNGKYALVYVFKRDEVQDLLEKFKRFELEIGAYVVKHE